MKKILSVMACAAFLAGCCGSEHGTFVPGERPLNEGNDGRIQQYLEESIMDSDNVVCNFDWLNQPQGNVVEVWALCEDFTVEKEELKKGAAVSMPVKITFANPSIHVVPADGADYMKSIEENFSEESIGKIKLESRNVADLERRNEERAAKWLLGEK